MWVATGPQRHAKAVLHKCAGPLWGLGAVQTWFCTNTSARHGASARCKFHLAQKRRAATGPRRRAKWFCTNASGRHSAWAPYKFGLAQQHRPTTWPRRGANLLFSVFKLVKNGATTSPRQGATTSTPPPTHPLQPLPSPSPAGANEKGFMKTAHPFGCEHVPFYGLVCVCGGGGEHGKTSGCCRLFILR